MWSHYASNHQGFCVEYELESFDTGDAFLRNLYPVVYSRELLDLTLWAEQLVTGKREDFNTFSPLLGVLQKFEGWGYEREWRYVSFKETPTADRSRTMPLPSRVFLGAKAPPSTTQVLLAICKEKNIAVWQMHMASDEYERLADPIQPAEQ
jgi:hypothetical protein